MNKEFKHINSKIKNSFLMIIIIVIKVFIRKDPFLFSQIRIKAKIIIYIHIIVGKNHL